MADATLTVTCPACRSQVAIIHERLVEALNMVMQTEPSAPITCIHCGADFEVTPENITTVIPRDDTLTPRDY